MSHYFTYLGRPGQIYIPRGEFRSNKNLVPLLEYRAHSKSIWFSTSSGRGAWLANTYGCILALMTHATICSIYKMMLFQAKESRNELVSLYLSKLHLISED